MIFKEKMDVRHSGKQRRSSLRGSLKTMSKFGKCIVLWEKEIQYFFILISFLNFVVESFKNSLVHLIQRENIKDSNIMYFAPII